MRLSVEIMLRGNNHVFTETLTHPSEPAAWTSEDVAAILKEMLRAMARAQEPEGGTPKDAALRGMNWIVQPASDGEGVVIAVEIHSALAVAGPIAMSAESLDGLMKKAIAADTRPGLVH